MRNIKDQFLHSGHDIPFLQSDGVMQNKLEIYQQIIDKQAEINTLIAQLQALNPELMQAQKKPSKRFEIPSIREIKEHIEAMGYSVDPEKFHAHYSSNGWMVGKNKMKCWKSALVTWNRQANNPGRDQSQWNNSSTPGTKSFFDAINSQDF